MKNSWLLSAQKLYALAETGKGFTKDHFDYERFEEISEIATSLLAMLANSSPEIVKGLIRNETQGYETPKIEVRGAVFFENRILLVREKEDGRWSMPGGYCDVGLSASENIEKEVFEEAGIEVKATRLYAIRHKAKGEYDLDMRDFYKIFFLCEARDPSKIQTGLETSEVGYFSLSDIPELSTDRVVMSDIKAAWQALNSPVDVFFD